jgi:hypothetical protein
MQPDDLKSMKFLSEPWENSWAKISGRRGKLMSCIQKIGILKV